MDFESAANALTEAAAAPEPGQAPAPVAAPAASEAPPTPSGVETGATEPTTPDSFTGIDPATLSPEMQQVYKSLQGDYTRKTQEIAEQRKSFDGLDVDRARQSLEFVDALETDPNFVVAVHQRLSEAMQEAGLSPEQADAAASHELGVTDPSLGAGFDEADPDSQLAKEVSELRAWKNQMEQDKAESDLASHLQRQEMAIRQSDPNLKEGDVDRIYQLAFAHNGDLNQAYADFKAWRDDVIGAYVQQKGEIATGVVTPSGDGSHASIPPEGFGTDLNKATDAAEEYLRNLS